MLPACSSLVAFVGSLVARVGRRSFLLFSSSSRSVPALLPLLLPTRDPGDFPIRVRIFPMAASAADAYSVASQVFARAAASEPSLPPIPPGVNPFDYALQQLRQSLSDFPWPDADHPPTSGERSLFASLDPWFKRSTFALMIGFSLISALFFCALVLPLAKGRSARSKLLWVWRVKHLGTFRSPHVVPNGRLACSLFGFVTSCRESSHLCESRRRSH